MSELLHDANFWYAMCVLVIVVIALAILKSYLKKLSTGKTPVVGVFRVESVKVADTDKSHCPYTLTLTVDGMNCADCVTRVENALNRHEGIWAQADVYTHKVTICMQRKEDEEKLQRAIEAIHHYSVVKDNENGRSE